MPEQTKGVGEIDQSIVEDLGGITVIRGGGKERGWNGIRYMQGMSAKNVGSTGLSVNVATVPPGAIAYAHNARLSHDFGVARGGTPLRVKH